MGWMTSRERVEAAFRHEEPDRTPYFEYVLLSPVADILLGRPYAADDSHWMEAVSELSWEGAVRQSIDDRLDLAVRLDHDMIYLWPAPLPSRETRPSGVPLEFGAALPGPDDPVERLIHRNEAEAASDPRPSGESRLVFEVLLERMEHRGLDLPVLAPAYAHGVWTDTDLMMSMVLAPEVAREHFALASRRSLAWTDAFIEMGIELIGVGGDFAGNRPILSPVFYRTFIVPEVRRLARRIHEAGRRAVNASDGVLWPVLDDFLIGCEVDGYLEIDMGAGMDLTRLKREYGCRITFMGNLDCGETLSFGTEEEIRRHVLDCIEAGLGNGGHILCASNAITGSVTPRHYMAAVNAYRERFLLRRITP